MQEVAIIQNEMGDILAVLRTEHQAQDWIKAYIVHWLGYPYDSEEYHMSREDYSICTMPIESQYTPWNTDARMT